MRHSWLMSKFWTFRIGANLLIPIVPHRQTWTTTSGSAHNKPKSMAITTSGDILAVPRTGVGLFGCPQCTSVLLLPPFCSPDSRMQTHTANTSVASPITAAKALVTWGGWLTSNSPDTVHLRYTFTHAYVFPHVV